MGYIVCVFLQLFLILFFIKALQKKILQTLVALDFDSSILNLHLQHCVSQFVYSMLTFKQEDVEYI